jgi:hypothetical protein
LGIRHAKYPKLRGLGYFVPKHPPKGQKYTKSGTTPGNTPGIPNGAFNPGYFLSFSRSAAQRRVCQRTPNQRCGRSAASSRAGPQCLRLVALTTPGGKLASGASGGRVSRVFCSHCLPARPIASLLVTKRNMGLSVVVCIQLPASAKQNHLLYSHIRNRPAGETILLTSDGGEVTHGSTRPLGNSQPRCRSCVGARAP